MGVLDGKTIVVTGASRGLGEAMAVGFAESGAGVVLAARTKEDLDRVAERCRAAGGRSLTVIPTDVTSEQQVQSLVDTTMSSAGRIDVFVANAGASYLNLTDKRYKELFTYDLDIVEQLFRLNAIGTWLCMKAALPVMPSGGSFINIGSEVGRMAAAGAGIYGVTKSVVDVMTLIVSKEMAEAGVRVNCLSPGGMADTHIFGPNKMPDFLKNLPGGYLEPEVIVPAAVWLASDESSNVTGAFISAKEFNANGPPS